MKTKSELAESHYGNQTFDFALPQGWVDACRDRGYEVVPHFVWLYDDYVGRPAPLTDEGDRYCPYWQELFETEPAPAGFLCH